MKKKRLMAIWLAEP